jgi:hypothetical protein
MRTLSLTTRESWSNPTCQRVLQVMDRDPRAEELNNLRLALAAFALQLDAFEARLKRRSIASVETTVKSSQTAPADIGFANKIVSAMKSLPTDPNDGGPKSD